MFDPHRYRLQLASRLTERRGAASLYSTDASGVGYRVTQRLERAGNESVDLSTLYLLCLHYRCSLGALVDPYGQRDPGQWAVDAPSMPDFDQSIRLRVRDVRHELGWGTRRLAAATADERIRPSYLFRVESGEVAGLDALRLAAIADVMGVSIVDLLPAELRSPGVERILPPPA
jgi:DNA-binding Xre family transcriptional regulator